MFENTDEVLVWAKKNQKRKVFKLKCNATVKAKLIEMFNVGVSKLIYDPNGNELIPITFESNYSVTIEDEKFIISPYLLPDEIKSAIENPDVVESFLPMRQTRCTQDGYEIKAIIVAGKDDKGYYVAGQKFSQRQITIEKIGLNMWLESDTFVENTSNFSFSITESVDCLFIENGLIFQKYYDANCVFDLGDYYRSASQSEVDSFISSKAFHIENLEMFNKAVKTMAIRKKIAKIIDLKTLDDVNRIRENASKVNLAINFTDDNNKIVLPVEKKELKKIMAFMAEEMYPGMFTNTIYVSNSTRQVNE